MGLRSRIKGKTFERLWATIVRDECAGPLPEVVEAIHRSIQSRGVEREGCDVAGFPKTWFECNHEIDPDPRKKLEQAEHDRPDPTFFPVAIVRRNRSRAINAYMRLEHLFILLGAASALLQRNLEDNRSTIVAMEARTFLRMLIRLRHWEAAMSFPVPRRIRQVRAR